MKTKLTSSHSWRPIGKYAKIEGIYGKPRDKRKCLEVIYSRYGGINKILPARWEQIVHLESTRWRLWNFYFAPPDGRISRLWNLLAEQIPIGESVRGKYFHRHSGKIYAWVVERSEYGVGGHSLREGEEGIPVNQNLMDLWSNFERVSQECGRRLHLVDCLFRSAIDRKYRDYEVFDPYSTHPLHLVINGRDYWFRRNRSAGGFFEVVAYPETARKEIVL